MRARARPQPRRPLANRRSEQSHHVELEIKLNDIRFSTTHILGYNLNEEILINRISGTIIISRTDSRLTEGKCELLDKKKF